MALLKGKIVSDINIPTSKWCKVEFVYTFPPRAPPPLFFPVRNPNRQSNSVRVEAKIILKNITSLKYIFAFESRLGSRAAGR